MELAVKKHFKIPTSGGLRTKMGFVAVTDAFVSGSWTDEMTCAKPLKDAVKTFQVGPVPFMVRFTSEARIGLSGKADLSNAGYRLRYGFEGSAYLPLVGLGDAKVSSDPIASVEPLEPTASTDPTVSGSLFAGISGELAFGPGIGNNDLGAQAGISGTLTPVEGDFAIQGYDDETCIEATLGGSGSVQLFASAWMPGFRAGQSLELFSKDWDYGGPWKYPAVCGQQILEYRIVGGSMTYDYAGRTRCVYPHGDCIDKSGGFRMLEYESNQKSVLDANVLRGESQLSTQFGGEPLPVMLSAPLHVNGFTYSRETTFSGTTPDGCGYSLVDTSKLSLPGASYMGTEFHITPGDRFPAISSLELAPSGYHYGNQATHTPLGMDYTDLNSFPFAAGERTYQQDCGTVRESYADQCSARSTRATMCRMRSPSWPHPHLRR